MLRPRESVRGCRGPQLQSPLRSPLGRGRGASGEALAQRGSSSLYVFPKPSAWVDSACHCVHTRTAARLCAKTKARAGLTPAPPQPSNSGNNFWPQNHLEPSALAHPSAAGPSLGACLSPHPHPHRGPSFLCSFFPSHTPVRSGLDPTLTLPGPAPSLSGPCSHYPEGTQD